MGDNKIILLTCEFLQLQEEIAHLQTHFNENKGYISIEEMLEINNNIFQMTKILKQLQRNYLMDSLQGTD